MTITTTYEAVLNIIRARLALDISLADNADAARLLCDDSDAALRSAIDGAWPAVALTLAPLVDEAPAEPLTMEIGALDVLPRGLGLAFSRAVEEALALEALAAIHAGEAGTAGRYSEMSRRAAERALAIAAGTNDYSPRHIPRWPY